MKHVKHVSIKHLEQIFGRERAAVIKEAKENEETAPMGPLIAALRFQWIWQNIREAIELDQAACLHESTSTAPGGPTICNDCGSEGQLVIGPPK